MLIERGPCVYPRREGTLDPLCATHYDQRLDTDDFG